MRRYLVTMLALSLSAGLAACSTAPQAPEVPAAAETSEEQMGDESAHTHKIGVLVYNRTDEEVQAFAHYLKDYIAEGFNVEFLYSDDVQTQEGALEFIRQAADNDVDGIMSFNSYDLAQEAELCAENEMYYMIASGSVSDEAFDSVSENPYFLGVVGPGSQIEYQAGADMASFFVQQDNGDAYTILSGGASMGNEMHVQRTMGILDTLQSCYGVSFEQSSEELAMSPACTHAQAGALTVSIIPGYLDFDVFLEPATAEYQANPYGNVLSVLPGSAMRDVLLGAEVGVIDCFTQQNMDFVQSGELKYVAGKYGSLIGPSFAAMYNAVTGYADAYRDNGKAFRIEQGFWIAADKQDYLDMYTLAASIEINAYNCEDLYQVCNAYNSEAGLEDLKALAAAYSFEDVKARRGM